MFFCALVMFFFGYCRSCTVLYGLVSKKTETFVFFERRSDATKSADSNRLIHTQKFPGVAHCVQVDRNNEGGACVSHTVDRHHAGHR
jgi:hypothetical protein